MEWMVSFSKNRFVIKDQVVDQAADVLVAEEVHEVQVLVVLVAAEGQNVPEAEVQAVPVVLILVHRDGRVALIPAVPVRAQAVVLVY